MKKKERRGRKEGRRERKKEGKKLKEGGGKA